MDDAGADMHMHAAGRVKLYDSTDGKGRELTGDSTHWAVRLKIGWWSVQECGVYGVGRWYVALDAIEWVSSIRFSKELADEASHRSQSVCPFA